MRQPICGAKRVSKHFLHHKRRVFDREIRVLKAGQIHEVIDQALQPLCLLEHLAVIFRNHGRLADNAVAECLQRAAQYGDRGAQLMGHVGQKIPSQLFLPLPVFPGLAEPAAEGIDRPCQIADLILLRKPRLRLVIPL